MIFPRNYQFLKVMFKFEDTQNITGKKQATIILKNIMLIIFDDSNMKPK